MAIVLEFLQYMCSPSKWGAQLFTLETTYTNNLICTKMYITLENKKERQLIAVLEKEERRKKLLFSSFPSCFFYRFKCFFEFLLLRFKLLVFLSYFCHHFKQCFVLLVEFVF